MKTQVNYEASADMVKTMRQIRDEISNEIKDMTFEEERAYLNHLLASREKKKSAPDQNIAARGAGH